MSSRDQQAYDRGVSVFSPEGRIYQVEYAREAVKRGAPSAGVQTDDGVVLAALTSNSSPLKVTESVEKINRVEESVGAVTTGYVPDGRRLIDRLRVVTQKDKIRYNEDPAVSAITKTVADHIQESTQVGGRRPYGASLIVGGIDKDGPSLYEVEPGGTPSEWRAVADGSNRNQYLDYFERHYDESGSVEDSIQLVVDAFREISDRDVTPQTVDLATVTTDEQVMTELTNDEVSEYTG